MTVRSGRRRTTALALGGLALLGVPGPAPRASAWSQDPSAAGPAPQIVNGLPTAGWPAVGLVALGSGGTCSATFIGCRTVLTAAHCVCDSGNPGPACPDGSKLASPGQLQVYLQHAGLFDVERIRVAPGYQFAAGSDVAVLDLWRPVRGVRPGSLNTSFATPFATLGTIVGFGRTTGVGDDGGIKRVGQVSTGGCPPGIPPTRNVCWTFEAPVGPPGSDSTTCFGDSGGPLFADLGAGPVLAGVHSGLLGSCAVDDQAWATEAFADSSWIGSEQIVDQAQTACGPGPQVGDPEVATAPFSGTTGSQATHGFSVPAGTKLLRATLNTAVGGGNDYDLYVRFGSPPTPSVFDCASIFGLSTESCELEDPAPGTWYVLVARFSGGTAEYQVTATMLPAHPVPPAPAAGDLLLADFYAGEIARVDAASGDRAIAASSLHGSGAPVDLPEDVWFDADGSLLATNVGIPALLRLDPATGNRSVVSGCADATCSSPVGAGPDFLGPRLLAREGGSRFVVSDRFGTTVSAVVRVDASSGERTLLSGCTDTSCSSERGAGPSLGRVFGIAVEDACSILVADTRAVLRIDPATGDRSVVSGCADPACTVEVGAGPSFGEPIGVAIEADDHILVTDSVEGSPFHAIFRVDPTSGARSVVSGCADPACSSQMGAGPSFGDGLWGIEIGPGGDLWVTDHRLEAVFRVDPGTGERTLVSGCADASCSAATGAGPLWGEPLGVTVVPEPGPAASLGAGLAALGLLRALARRRAQAAEEVRRGRFASPDRT